MLLINKNKQKPYEDFMNEVALVIYESASANISEITGGLGVRELSNSDTHAVAEAAGQVVLDRILELTKDLSKEDIILFLAQSSVSMSISAMNHHPLYLAGVKALSDLKKL